MKVEGGLLFIQISNKDKIHFLTFPDILLLDDNTSRRLFYPQYANERNGNDIEGYRKSRCKNGIHRW